jgi:hypothetical protein
MDRASGARQRLKKSASAAAKATTFAETASSFVKTTEDKTAVRKADRKIT